MDTSLRFHRNSGGIRPRTAVLGGVATNFRIPCASWPGPATCQASFSPCSRAGLADPSLGQRKRRGRREGENAKPSHGRPSLLRSRLWLSFYRPPYWTQSSLDLRTSQELLRISTFFLPVREKKSQKLFLAIGSHYSPIP